MVGILGIFVLLGIAYSLSNNKSKIDFKLVSWGLVIQFLFALLILKSPIGKPVFSYLDKIITKLISFSDAGGDFLFKSFVPDVGFHVGLINFAFRALPTIVFFSGLMAVMYHWGIIQFVVKWIAKGMQKTMGTSGSETLSVSANIFVGQTEAPLMVRPFISKMTKSELMSVMTGGFATAAGGVLALYVIWLKDIPGIAGHLLAASVMSAPAAMVIAKIIYPETEESETMGDLKVEVEKTDTNSLDALGRGATEGLKLAVNVAAMLVAFVSVVAMFNYMDGIIESNGLTNLNYFIMGQVCVDKLYRGQGVFRGLYSFLNSELKKNFDAVVTEVNAKNRRSSEAHKAIGFELLDAHTEGGEDWELIIMKF